jgi:hypothetical protein
MSSGMTVGDKVRTKRTFHTSYGQEGWIDIPVGTVGSIIDKMTDLSGISLYEVEFEKEGRTVEFLAYFSELEIVS